MEEENTIVFRVGLTATKRQVKAAFNLIYNVGKTKD